MTYDRKVAKYTSRSAEIMLIPKEDGAGYRDAAGQWWTAEEVPSGKITEGIALFDDEKSVEALYKAAREGLQAGLSAHAVQSVIRALLNPKPDLPEEPTRLGAKIKVTSVGDTLWTAAYREANGRLVWRSEMSGTTRYWDSFEKLNVTIKVVFNGWDEDE